MRWDLDDAQLAAGLEAAKPAPDVPLPRLRADARASAPPESEAALAILAQPARALSLTINAQDALGFAPALVATQGAQVAALTQTREGWALALHANASAAIDALAPALGLDGAVAGSARHTFDLSGFAAILAAADLTQEAALEARLRRLRLPPPEITARQLERSLARGLTTGDTRWAVCAARWSAPVSLAAARRTMKEAVQALDETSWALARSLADVRAGAGITALAWENGARRVKADAMTLATPGALWWLDWEGVPSSPRVVMSAADAATVNAKLAGWLTA